MKLYARESFLDLKLPKIMGILNITPDSFSDGNQYNKFNHALIRTEEMIKTGAEIIDIGGESTRPGSQKISLHEELDRVIPIIEAISKRFDIWISVNTSKALVITEATKVGVHMINDVRSLCEPGALQAAKHSNLPICLMHMKGTPQNMQQFPNYQDIINEINLFFLHHIKRCQKIGIKKSNLLLDPGFGFGKSLEHNYKLLAKLEYFNHFGLPILVGMSRKSMIGKLLNLSITDRIIGSVTCAIIALMKGTHIIRVHDVKETAMAVKIIDKVKTYEDQ